MHDFLRSFVAGFLLIGAGSVFAQGQVCDVDVDGDVDRVDIGLIAAARNTPASGPADPADPDRDGVITVLDARTCQRQCTLSRCAELTGNHPPIANAGSDQTVTIGDTVTLNGSGSSDSDGDPLTFSWMFVSTPTGSTATLSDPSAVLPVFVADQLGDYVIELVVSDGVGTDTTTAIVSSVPLTIEAIVDEITTQRTGISIQGGSLQLLTAENAIITMIVPEFAVAEQTEFSMSEITSTSGFPEGVNVLAAAQFGPAGVMFAQPVEITFDVSGMRTPGTALVGFGTTNDGENLRLIPLFDTIGTAGSVATSRDGGRVSLSVFGFSNFGVIEIEGVGEISLSFSGISQQPDIELPDELVLELLNVALGADLDLAEAQEILDEEETRLIRQRRTVLHGEIEEFMNRDVMTPDFLDEFMELVISLLITDNYDEDFERTSLEEYVASQSLTAEFAQVYGAGLHLQCFVNPNGLNDTLGIVAAVTLLRFGSDLVEGNPSFSFDDLAQFVEELGRCFNQPILDAYFESFDLAMGDEFFGEATNIFVETTDNIQNQQSLDPQPDTVANVQFIQPRLISENPLTFEFLEVSGGNVTGLFSDFAQVTFNAPSGDQRVGDISMSEQTVTTTVIPPAAVEDGERPIITVVVTSVASGPITVTPTSISIRYTFDRDETSDGLLVNVTRHISGDVIVSKDFTPRSFAEEIELFFLDLTL